MRLHAYADVPLSKYEVTPDTDEAMQEIAARFEVTHRHGNSFEIIVPQNRANELRGLSPNARLILKDLRDEIKGRLLDDPEWFAGYHNFESVQAYLRSVAEQYPTLAKTEVYGTSKQGRPLLALKLSDNVHLNEAEPEIMITSATHGDELITVEVVLGVIKSLLEGYGKVDRVTRMIEGKQLYFIPVVNPDGYVAQSRYANGVDPNRDYPWPERPDRNPVDCIRHLIAFFHQHDFKGSIDYHAFGQLIMYPWAYTYDSVESFEERQFEELTGPMAQTNGYTAGQISKVIYVAKGSSADYFFWKNKTKALGIEIGRSKVPHSSQIASQINENLESTWRFIEYFN
ncbi:MAG: M14 family zinc carboxypeptidase [Bdellovibrionota bacterium]